MPHWFQSALFLLTLIWMFIQGLRLEADQLRVMQKLAADANRATWAHWGTDRKDYTGHSSHSNRLIPVYTFGIGLDEYAGQNSVYRDQRALEQLYGRSSTRSLNSRAEYFDQTDIYRLQKAAVASGKRYIILIVFDGMDWQTTRAAAIYAAQRVGYSTGRGTGLSFQDFDEVRTDYGSFVTSPHNSGTEVDVDGQAVINSGGSKPGGYSPRYGAIAAWARPRSEKYMLGKLKNVPHAVADSAASATSMTSGIKTYNGAINVDPEGRHVVPLARTLQAESGFSIGIVTSVQISHATPAAAYANNVTRNDYQDLTRDLLGLRSISHRSQPLPGVDVLIGAGWGVTAKTDEGQGNNFEPGNVYLADSDLRQISIEDGGKYRVVQRTRGKLGGEELLVAARKSHEEGSRFFGYFGVAGGKGRKAGHLPYQTADGSYNPVKPDYSSRDVRENPTLAEMTRVALVLLSRNKKGFWLMVEAGDVDWANHSNDIDSSIGAVLSGDEAFRMVTRWATKRQVWDDTAIIVTSDHGHYLVLDRPNALLERRQTTPNQP